MPKYPHVVVTVTLKGPGGNAFAIIGGIQKDLRRAGASIEEIEAYTKDSEAGDYDHVLDVATEWVTFKAF